MIENFYWEAAAFQVFLTLISSGVTGIILKHHFDVLDKKIELKNKRELKCLENELKMESTVYEYELKYYKQLTDSAHQFRTVLVDMQKRSYDNSQADMKHHSFDFLELTHDLNAIHKNLNRVIGEASPFLDLDVYRCVTLLHDYQLGIVESLSIWCKECELKNLPVYVYEVAYKYSDLCDEHKCNLTIELATYIRNTLNKYSIHQSDLEEVVRHRIRLEK